MSEEIEELQGAKERRKQVKKECRCVLSSDLKEISDDICPIKAICEQGKES